MAINLTTVDALLGEAREIIHAHDGLDMEDFNSIQNARDARAEVTRDLLRLADLLTTAAALTREEYWRAKNYPSPIPRVGEEMSRL